MAEIEKTPPPQARIDKKVVDLISDRLDCFAHELIPDGDVACHYEYHKRAIERKRTQDELKSELLKKGIVWAIGSIFVVLGLSLWEYLKHSITK